MVPLVTAASGEAGYLRLTWLDWALVIYDHFELVFELGRTQGPACCVIAHDFEITVLVKHDDVIAGFIVVSDVVAIFKRDTGGVE